MVFVWCIVELYIDNMDHQGSFLLMDTSLAVDSDLVSVPVSWSQSCLESSPNSSAKKVRLSGSLSPLGCIEKHSRDVSVSDCMLVDSDYMFMELCKGRSHLI
jgi:hypothetical protein